MTKLKPGVNTGLLIEKRETDYELGGNSPIVHEARNLTRNWRPFRSRPERQGYARFDAFDCVSQASTNSWEAQANWMLANSLWPVDALKFWNEKGYIVNGKFEISERHIAKESGTTRAGNSFQRVLDALRKVGVVPESLWPSTLDPNIDKIDWDEFYKEIPQELKDLAKESLKYYSLLYESIARGSQKNRAEDIRKALEHAPILLGIATCSPWYDRVPVCDSQPNHAVLNDCFEKSYYIWDSYEKFEKFLEPGYIIHFAYKAVLYPVKRNEPIKKPLFQDINNLRYGKTNEDVKVLQRLLNVVDTPTGYYGGRTQRFVYDFQRLNNVASLLEVLFVRGRWVGQKTLAKLEELYNK